MSNPAESAVADTRDRLIQAAREVFMEEGYRASVEGISKGAWTRAREPEWSPVCHRACVANPGRLPGEPVGDWTLKRVSHDFCDLCPDTSAAPMFLWGGFLAGLRQNIATPLDPNGWLARLGRSQ
jgi:hypothetical protein